MPARRTENREDRLELDRAIAGLEQASKSLKAFSKTRSVGLQPDLEEQVRKIRRSVKKALKHSQGAIVMWDAPSEG